MNVSIGKQLARRPTESVHHVSNWSLKDRKLGR